MQKVENHCSEVYLFGEEMINGVGKRGLILELIGPSFASWVPGAGVDCGMPFYV